MQRHFIGLTVAARYAKMDGVISGQMRKKLILLDNAFAVARHITQPATRDLLSNLRDMMAATRASAGPDLATDAKDDQYEETLKRDEEEREDCGRLERETQRAAKREDMVPAYDVYYDHY